MLDARFVYFVFVHLFRFVFHSRKTQVIIFQRPGETTGVEKRKNGDANQVDEEHNRRVSIFLPINLLKMSTSRFDSLATRWGKDRSKPSFVTRFLS